MTRVAEVSKVGGEEGFTGGVSDVEVHVLSVLLVPAEEQINDVNSRASMEGCGSKLAREAWPRAVLMSGEAWPRVDAWRIPTTYERKGTDGGRAGASRGGDAGKWSCSGDSGGERVECCCPLLFALRCDCEREKRSGDVGLRWVIGRLRRACGAQVITTNETSTSATKAEELFNDDAIDGLNANAGEDAAGATSVQGNGGAWWRGPRALPPTLDPDCSTMPLCVIRARLSMAVAPS